MRMLGLHTIFMGLTVATVALGVRNGMERLVKLLMPTLFILLVYMAVFAASTSGFEAGLHYLFYPDWSKLSAEAVMVAMGQAFFSLSLGMGALMAYGAYLPKNASIFKVSASIAMVDMLVAILAGLVIFPLVFTYELEVGSGPGLIFITLPIAFGQFSHGQVIGTCFFSLLLFAAWTSAISLLEPAVTWLIENRQISRTKAACIMGLLIWTVGIGTVLSFNLWENYQLFGKTFFDILEYVSSNVMLPMGGLLIAFFTAWKMSKKSMSEELASGDRFFRIWSWIIAYVAPVGVLLIFLHAIKVV
ncbi:Sodium-dependent transporter family protein [uncultured Candidatus Thioglobus sp.]|nr:Sodium-dependent transporter family protein [uncultured Candidatus Thioglobus sp.]